MKIAIPIENGRLYGHFGGCREFALVEADVDQKRTLNTEIVPAPEHRPGLFPRWMRGRGANLIIAGGIGQRALAAFAHHGIVVRAGIPGAPVDQLVTAYMNGLLTVTPDGCGHRGHHHEHHHHHHEHGHHHGQEHGGASSAASNLKAQE